MSAWFVALLYVTTVCAGEGWHLIVGCDHIEHVACSGPRQDAGADDRGLPGCRHALQFRPVAAAAHACHDADGCPICKLALLPAYGGPAAAVVSRESILYQSLLFAEPTVSAGVGSSFLSRGPPTV